jgi:hypothetical protein
MKSTLIKNILRGIVGIALLPILFGIFLFDRLILVALPHVQSPSILEVLSDVQKFVPSIIRVVTVGFLTAIYLIIINFI